MCRVLRWHKLEENLTRSNSFVMIRFAEQNDLPRIVEMATEAITTIPRYKEKILPNREAITRYMTHLIASPVVWFVVIGPIGNPHGMLAASKGFHPLEACPMVSELFWWVDPRKRGRGFVLLKSMLEWGASEGAQLFVLGGSSKKVGKFYRHFGFEKLEDIYVKRAA